MALGKIVISVLSAFVFSASRFGCFAFWRILITLMLPVEARIIPTFAVVANLGMLSPAVVPLIASAPTSLPYRQFFLTVADELTEAARASTAPDRSSSSGKSCCPCRAPNSRR
jgi:sn-glycerol 3-phosphate transport system permease protein